MHGNIHILVYFKLEADAQGLARGGSWGARDPPLVGLLLSKRKRHDNILAVKAIVEKPTFFKFVFL